MTLPDRTVDGVVAIVIGVYLGLVIFVVLVLAGVVHVQERTCDRPHGKVICATPTGRE